MDDKDTLTFINNYLTAFTKNKKFISKSQQLSYEKGILSALLLYLLSSDFQTRKLMSDKIKK